MASFDVVVRGGYRDVGGLVLDCAPGDFSLARSDRIETWRNRAPLRAGVPKFGDLFNSSSHVLEMPHPTVDGGARFVRAEATTLFASSIGDFGIANQRWTFAFHLVKGPVNTNSQAVLGDAATPDKFTIYRRRSGSQAVYTTTSLVTPGGDMGDGVTMFAFNPAGTFDLTTDNSPIVTSGACSPFTFAPDSEFALNVGRFQGGGDYLDATLYRVVGWRRQLSPLERDLAHRDLSGLGVDLSTQARAGVELKVWRDGTADPTRRQVSRLRPMVGAQPLYFEVDRGGLGAARVQLACEVDGVVPHDSDLGGDLFTGSVVERAGPVTFFQDAEWSAVFDVEVRRAGHYALLFARPDHGGRVVHFDVV